MKKITIAIDGYSATGKSTIAKKLAQKLAYTYIDTGAMYRAVTLFALQHNYIDVEKANIDALLEELSSINLTFKFNKKLGYAEIYLNNENVEEKIRSIKVSNYVSKIAEIPEIRQKLVDQQQKMGKNKGVVMDGRDIGTVVFPDAELKLFLTASTQTRAKRRYKELLEKDEKVAYQNVLKNIEDRDFIDSHRKTSPLKKADDAIEFDNTDMGIEEQLERIYNFALRIINQKV